MPVELGMALKLLGGAPHLKVGSFIAENLPIAKVLDGGPLGELLAQVLKNGPQALLQNPIAAVTEQLQGALSAAAGALGSIPGADGLVSALTGSSGLSAAISGLSGAADLLSGVAMPGAGQFGLLDVVTHTSIIDMLGDALPPAMALEQAIGPLTAGTSLGQIASGVTSMARAVQSGAMSVADATAWVNAETRKVAGIASASTMALSSAQNAAQALASVSTASALLVSANPTLRALVPMVAQPSVLPAMQAAVASHVTL